MKYINLVKRLIRKIILCVRPYNGFRNRKIFKDFSGFQRDFYIKFWTDASNAIGASMVDIGYGFFKITKGDNKTYVRNFNVMLDDNLTLNIAGNKPFVLNILSDYDFQIPRFLEYKIEQLAKAESFLTSLGKNAVVKPASGTGAGRGVTTHISDIKKLHKASIFASSFCDTLLIEEQVEGDSFRLLYIEGEFIDALRRDPPVVIGDGKSTIKKLIEQENNKRIKSDEILTFHPLIIDMECKLKLKEQCLSISSVLNMNQKVIVKTVVNQNSCFENHVVRDEIHPSIVSTGQQIVNELGITLGGIDVITSDITVPLQQSGGVINEINTTPGLHHHSLVFEKNKILPIGEMVLNYIFSKK